MKIMRRLILMPYSLLAIFDIVNIEIQCKCKCVKCQIEEH